jgi:hypothetical protein
MQRIDITDPVEAQRCRFAQYRGQKATVMLNGLPVTGMVRSVMEVSQATHALDRHGGPKQGMAA